MTEYDEESWLDTFVNELEGRAANVAGTDAFDDSTYDALLRERLTDAYEFGYLAAANEGRPWGKFVFLALVACLLLAGGTALVVVSPWLAFLGVPLAAVGVCVLAAAMLMLFR